MNPKLIFIAGIPSVGKSTFGSWLSENHGYLHIDAEVNGQLEKFGLRKVWDESLYIGNAGPLALELSSRNEPAIFNWGFPMSHIHFVRTFKKEGFDLWWLDADLNVARNYHHLAGKNLPSFDEQVKSIVSSRVEIEYIFQGNILDVLNATGERLSPEQIFKSICGR